MTPLSQALVTVCLFAFTGCDANGIVGVFVADCYDRLGVVTDGRGGRSLTAFFGAWILLTSDLDSLGI